MRFLVLAILALTACQKKDGDVICRRTLLSHPYVYADGVERKSDVFECVERASHAECMYIEPTDGQGPTETDCNGDVLLSR